MLSLFPLTGEQTSLFSIQSSQLLQAGRAGRNSLSAGFWKLLSPEGKTELAQLPRTITGTAGNGEPKSVSCAFSRTQNLSTHPYRPLPQLLLFSSLPEFGFHSICSSLSLILPPTSQPSTLSLPSICFMAFVTGQIDLSQWGPKSPLSSFWLIIILANSYLQTGVAGLLTCYWAIMKTSLLARSVTIQTFICFASLIKS